MKYCTKFVEFQVDQLSSTKTLLHNITNDYFYSGINKLLLSLKCKMFVEFYFKYCSEIKIFHFLRFLSFLITQNLFYTSWHIFNNFQL